MYHVDRDTTDPRIRRIYTRASVIAVAGNVVLLAAKGAAALISGSSAIYADAANSAADVAYSLLMGLGLWLSLRPPDASHPHGHRRFESLVSLLIGGAMGFAAWEAARRGVASLQAEPPVLSAWAVGALVGTGLIKAAMFYEVRRLGRDAGSPAVLAAAQDNLTDTISSATALLGYLGSRLVPVADPVAAFLVAAWILHGAARVFLDGLRQIVGGAGSVEITRAVAVAAREVPGVLGVERVLVEHCGPKLCVDVHVKMAEDAPLRDVHRASHDVRRAIEALEAVEHAFVHVEPMGG